MSPALSEAATPRLEPGAISGLKVESVPAGASSRSMPSAETQASANRCSGSSSRTSVAVRSSASGAGASSAPVAVAITARTPSSVPMTRNSSNWAVAIPLRSMLSSTPSYSDVRGSPTASELAYSLAPSPSSTSSRSTRSGAGPAPASTATAASPPNHGRTSASKSSRPMLGLGISAAARVVSSPPKTGSRPASSAAAAYSSLSGSRLACR